MKTTDVFVLMIFLFCGVIHSAYECIGLGETCTVAAALEVFNLRNAAYPFDWIISEYRSVCNILEEDFQDFLNPDYLSIHPNFHGVINKYGLVFVHDFPTVGYTGELNIDAPLNEDILHPDWINALPEIEKKYLRRIERFRHACMSNKKIFFIRHQGIKSVQEACVLRNILKKSYPNLDFILIIVGNDSSFAEPWDEPNIKNYYLKQTSVWNDVNEWATIFKDLGLVTEFKNMNLQEKMDYHYIKYTAYFGVESHDKMQKQQI